MNVKITKTESVTNRTMLAVEKLQRIIARWLTSDEQELVNRVNDTANKNADAGTLYILHTEYGFTKEQLIEFLNKFREKYGYLENNLSFGVEEIPEVKKLQDIGVDLTAFYEGETI